MAEGSRYSFGVRQVAELTLVFGTLFLIGPAVGWNWPLSFGRLLTPPIVAVVLAADFLWWRGRVNGR